jgi:PTS system cellobiose-specific IIB component
MKRIYIFCAQGVSTSILVNCMKRYISQEGYNYEVYAYPILKINELGKLFFEIGNKQLVPELSKHDLYRVKELLPEKPIEVIDPFVYGQMNGQELVVQIVEKLGK